VRHAAGVTASGYSERGAVDYGVRYELSFMQSATSTTSPRNMGSVYLNGTVLGSLPLGIEGYYSVDNHSYRTWGLTLSGSVRCEEARVIDFQVLLVTLAYSSSSWRSRRSLRSGTRSTRSGGVSKKTFLDRCGRASCS